MRYFMTFSYDGSNFSGYQKQPREKTVQGELEKALKEIKQVKSVKVVLEEKKVEIILKEDIDNKILENTIEDLGYKIIKV